MLGVLLGPTILQSGTLVGGPQSQTANLDQSARQFATAATNASSISYTIPVGKEPSGIAFD
ncbi:MAG: hypothetical protein ACHQ1H_14895, partial [Nitrososphaerales archaeon]